MKPEGFYAAICYSPRAMTHDHPVKALVIALTDHAAAAVYSINRLQPDSLCFVLPEGAKSLVESEVQPKIEHLPRRWDWVVMAEPGEFVRLSSDARPRHSRRCCVHGRCSQVSSSSI